MTSLPKRWLRVLLRCQPIVWRLSVQTQGSDTKLVAEMLPYHEAKSTGRSELGGRSVAPLVTQIFGS